MEEMNQIILGAMAGWFSGGLGYIIAGKFHGEEKGQTWYPAYAAVLFCSVIVAAKNIL
jgi:hypothetical protein